MVNPIENPITQMIMSDSSNATDSADVSFQIQLPDEWDPGCAKTNVGVTAAVETDKCNPDWINRCNQMSHVVVPSSFTAGLMRGTGNITSPLSVIHEGFDNDIVSDGEVVSVPGNFNFLIISQLTSFESDSDRKNLGNTIKWFCDAFKDDPEVGLVIKTNLGRATSIDKMNTLSVLKKHIGDVRKGPFPKIHVIHGDMSTKELGSLYRHPSIKCLVNLTRGEGFGLPMLEAAANGLPIIATNWSGHLDILSLGKFIPVDYTLQKIPDSRVDGRIFMKDTRWASPSEEDFKRRIKKFRTSHITPTEWARDMMPKVRNNFSMQSIYAQYDREVGRYL
jgi:glycosyltransferase involved in cell wall biosynthesis